MLVYVEDNGTITAFAPEESGITPHGNWKTADKTIAEPIADERGIFIYKFVNNKITDRTQAEINADWIAEEAERKRQEEEAPPTDLERVEAQIMYTALMTGTLLEEEE